MFGRLAIFCLAALTTAALAAPAASAAPKRVVALEWEVMENLAALGVTPVGAADVGGYRDWVGVPAANVSNVGSRQAPSLERIARLRPDLIIVPRMRSTKNLGQLKRIATVLQYDQYPRGRNQFDVMVANFRRMASAVGRRSQGERVLRQLSTSLRRNATAIRRAGRRGARVTFAMPSGTTSSPTLRLFTSNSIVAGVFGRLGIRNYWGARAGTYGFSEVGIESLRKVQKGWLAFLFPRQFSSVISRYTGRSSYKRLDMVRKGRVLRLPGDTWPFGGPRSTALLADRVTALLTRRR